MKLHEIRLKNYQGLRDYTFRPEGHDATIYGTNASGKTTVYNAFTWMLYGRPSTAEKNYSPKTRTADGGEEHRMEHSVEATFITPDERLLTLGKTYREEWTQKRGSATDTFSGHKTDYSINGVPVTKSAYEEALEGYGLPEERLGLILSIPAFFPAEIHWQERREILLEVCGDVDDAAVFANNPELAELERALQGRSIDDHKKVAKAQQAKINDELRTIPARIDEQRRDLSDADRLWTREELQTNIDSIKADVRALREQADSIEDGTEAADLRRALADLKAEEAEEKAKEQERVAEVNAEGFDRIKELEAERRQVVFDETSKSGLVKELQAQVAYLKDKRAQAVEAYNRAQEERWEGAEDCPTCKRPLDPATIEEARATFNEAKSARLEKIKESAAKFTKDVIRDKEQEVEQATHELDVLQKQAHDIELQIDRLRAGMARSTHEPQYLEIAIKYNAERAKLQRKVNDLTSDTEKRRANAREAVRARERDLKAAEAMLAQIDLRARKEQRIAELKDRERELAGAYEDKQREIYLCDEFTKAKVAALDERINGAFERVKFRLFEEQVNGGIKDVCDVMIPTNGRLVPYDAANRAGQIEAGLDIINIIGHHYNQRLPVFVDNAESIVNVPSIEAQTIKLIVSAEDTILRAEINKKEEALQ